MRDFDETVFAAALLDPDMPVPDGIAETSDATRQDRFAVYRNNVVQGLVEALETRFPAVRQSVGETFFAAAARIFAMNHPPCTPIMTFYGEEFPAFLAAFEPCSELPYLPDLARLEAARTRAYHAADAAPVPQEAFAQIASTDLARLRLTLHPSLFILASPHPVATIFAMNTGQQPVAPIEDWEGEDVLVARPGMIVEVHRLAPGGAAFLTRLSEGATLVEAAEAALETSQSFDLAINLADLIRFGLITRISSAPSSIQ